MGKLEKKTYLEGNNERNQIEFANIASISAICKGPVFLDMVAYDQPKR